MIPKHSFACFFMLLTLSVGQPGHAAVADGNGTTLGAMETKLFSHPYKGESENSRLNRLEEFVFGAADASGTAQDRLSHLSSCVSTRRQTVVTKPISNLTNISSYPRVTQLELRLIGESHFGEPIANRLSRLEIVQFGQASTSKDLAERMDVLAAIAASNTNKTKANELTALQSPLVVAANYRKQFYQDMQIAPISIAKEQPSTVVDQIEYLECTAFGQKHSNKTLQKRVDALEAKYYGEQKVADKNLTHRVAELLALVSNNSVKNSPLHG